MNEFDPSRPRFYFSLLRLMAMLRGADATRAETNETEAWLAGVAMYLIGFLFFAQFVPVDPNFWLTALALIILAFLVWLFWLLVLYFNSLIIRLLRPAGFFQNIPTRRAQSILLGLWATTMAFDLARRGSWMSEIAAIWLVAVGLNLAAAVILAFRNGARTE
jgi:hypothetical protein